MENRLTQGKELRKCKGCSEYSNCYNHSCRGIEEAITKLAELENQIDNNELAYKMPPLPEDDYVQGYTNGRAYGYQKGLNELAWSTQQEIEFKVKEAVLFIIHKIKEQYWDNEIDDWLIATAINEICDKYNLPEEKISDKDIAFMEEHVYLDSPSFDVFRDEEGNKTR